MKFFQKLFFIIDYGLAQIALFFIFLYQKTISPDKGIFAPATKGKVCSHEPHCSEYGKEVLKRYGFLNGIGKVSDRVLHCTLKMNKMYDPSFYRTVFFCSAPIGIPFLEELAHDKRFEVVGIVTQADKPAGRGMKLQENIIKSTAKSLFPTQGKKIKKILMLHGFFADNNRARFPKIKKRAEEHKIDIKIPILPNANLPVLQEQVSFLLREYKDRIDEDTIIIGHSLGGLLMKHFVVALDQPIKKVISICPAIKGKDYQHIFKKSSHEITKTYLDTYLNHESLDTEKFNTLVAQHVVYISKDDPWIPYEKSKVYHETYFPNAHITSFEDKKHFDQEMPNFEELLQPDFSDFIQTPEKLNPEKSLSGKNFYDWLKAKNPEYLVVISYGKIIPQAILDIPTFGPINIHGSLLPKYRGASPLQSIFLNKEKETGITIMHMDATMDTGNIIDKMKFKLPFDRTTLEVIEEMKKSGPKFLTTTLRRYAKGLLGEEKQNEKEATTCKKIEKIDGKIDPRNDSIENIYQKYRAYFLRPKIWFEHNGKTIIIEKLHIEEKLFQIQKDNPLLNEKNDLNPCIQEIFCKPEGKKTMDRKNFINGYL